jgi:hypothetical protein
MAVLVATAILPRATVITASQPRARHSSEFGGFRLGDVQETPRAVSSGCDGCV